MSLTRSILCISDALSYNPVADALIYIYIFSLQLPLSHLLALSLRYLSLCNFLPPLFLACSLVRSLFASLFANPPACPSPSLSPSPHPFPPPSLSLTPSPLSRSVREDGEKDKPSVTTELTKHFFKGSCSFNTRQMIYKMHLKEPAWYTVASALLQTCALPYMVKELNKYDFYKKNGTGTNFCKLVSI